MLITIRVFTGLGTKVVLEYASGRLLWYEGTPHRLLTLSRCLIRLLNRNRGSILCRPFYDDQPGYVVFRKEIGT